MIVRVVASLALAASGAACVAVTAVGTPSPDLAFAFVSVRDGAPQVFVRDQTGERAVTRGRPASQPAWSPDARRLALIRYEDGGTSLYVHDLAAGEAKRVGSAGSAEYGPAFSPDGRSLAFLGTEPTGKSWLNIADLTGGAPVRVPLPGKTAGSTAPVWSADGRVVAFTAADASGRSQVFVTSRDGSDLRVVSKAPRAAAHAALSPDGRSVAYIQDMRDKGVDLFVADVDTGAARNLTEALGANHEQPRWSPDGKWIAFASNREDRVLDRTDIFVMRPDGSDLRNLTRDPGEDFDPKWTADGRTILFTSLRNGTSQIYAVDVASSTSARLTQGTAQSFEHAPRPAPR